MAETVTSMETPQPPSNTAPSSSTPSQPAQLPPTSSPAPQVFASTDLLSQQPQQPPSQSPAPTMPASVQPQTHTQNNISNTTFPSSYPSRAPPGAPARNYLNTHLAPYLRNGMTNILDAKPQYPLRWLGEYLISQSLIHEGGTDEKGIVERFIYEEHGLAVKKLRPESTSAVVQGANQDMVDGGGMNGVYTEGEKEAGGQEKEVEEQDTEMGGS